MKKGNRNDDNRRLPPRRSLPAQLVHLRECVDNLSDLVHLPSPPLPRRQGAEPCIRYMLSGKCDKSMGRGKYRCAFDHPLRKEDRFLKLQERFNLDYEKALDRFSSAYDATCEEHHVEILGTLLWFASDVYKFVTSAENESQISIDEKNLAFELLLGIAAAAVATFQLRLDKQILTLTFAWECRIVYEFYPEFQQAFLQRTALALLYGRHVDAVINRFANQTLAWKKNEDKYRLFFASRLSAANHNTETMAALDNSIALLYADRMQVIDSRDPIQQAILTTLQQELAELGCVFKLKERPTFDDCIDEEPLVNLAIFGSAANALGSQSCDIDISLTVTIAGKDVTDRLNVVETLSVYFESITSVPRSFSIARFVPQARVPVLRLVHLETSIEVDVCVGNYNAILNTRLLRHYSLCDIRVHQLIITVKHWAAMRGVNNSQNATLTSYAWVLLVIFFCQRLPMDPPLLLPMPAEATSATATATGAEEETTSTTTTTTTMMMNQAQIKQMQTLPRDISVGRLLVLFFVYYGLDGNESSEFFNVYKDVSSIRHAVVFPKPLSSNGSNRPTTKIDDEGGEEDEGNEGGEEGVGRELIRQKVGENTSSLKSLVAAAADVPWRFAIEDPFEVHDLGGVVRQFEGQQFIMEEIRRALVICAHFFHTSDHTSRGLFDVLTEANQSIPHLPFTCNNCGSEAHNSRECPTIFCYSCRKLGHVRQMCPKNACRICNVNGHKAADCPMQNSTSRSNRASSARDTNTNTNSNSSRSVKSGSGQRNAAVQAKNSSTSRPAVAKGWAGLDDGVVDDAMDEMRCLFNVMNTGQADHRGNQSHEEVSTGTLVTSNVSPDAAGGHNQRRQRKQRQRNNGW